MTSTAPPGDAAVLVHARSTAAWCTSWLEQGAAPTSWRTVAARGYAAAVRSHLARPLALPDSVQALGVGSAVLGGAGKTPVAIELARELASHGDSVAFVGHAYLARPRCPRLVSPDDDVGVVGDDALVAARALHSLGVPVWVAPRRADAVAAAARHARTIVIDGLLQSRPRRLSRSLLVLDALAPLGSGCCPPAGDLRGSPADLIECCDEIVLVRDPLGPDPAPLGMSLRSRPVRSAWIDLRGALDIDGVRLSLRDLRSARLGLLTLIGRPGRVLAALSRRGISPRCHWAGPDHGSPGPWARFSIRRMAARFRLDAWLITSKCLPHLAGSDTGAPLWTLDVRARLDPSPEAVLESRACAPHVCSTSC